MSSRIKLWLGYVAGTLEKWEMPVNFYILIWKEEISSYNRSQQDALFLNYIFDIKTLFWISKIKLKNWEIAHLVGFYYTNVSRCKVLRMSKKFLDNSDVLWYYTMSTCKLLQTFRNSTSRIVKWRQIFMDCLTMIMKARLHFETSVTTVRHGITFKKA
jgi:hypothetical protein